jgi:hypothetical protein
LRRQKPVQNIASPHDVRDLSLDEARPERAAAIESQIDRDDPGDNFTKEKLHRKVRSSPGLVWPDLVPVQLHINRSGPH